MGSPNSKAYERMSLHSTNRTDYSFHLHVNYFPTASVLKKKRDACFFQRSLGLCHLFRIWKPADTWSMGVSVAFISHPVYLPMMLLYSSCVEHFISEDPEDMVVSGGKLAQSFLLSTQHPMKFCDHCRLFTEQCSSIWTAFLLNYIPSLKSVTKCYNMCASFCFLQVLVEIMELIKPVTSFIKLQSTEKCRSLSIYWWRMLKEWFCNFSRGTLEKRFQMPNAPLAPNYSGHLRTLNTTHSCPFC